MTQNKTRSKGNSEWMRQENTLIAGKKGEADASVTIAVIVATDYSNVAT